VQPNTPNNTYNPSFSSEDTNDSDDDDSLLEYQESSGNIFSFDNISHMSDNDDHSSTVSYPSLYEIDENSISTDENEDDDDDNDTATCSNNSAKSQLSDTSLNGDPISKTFLQLKGITVANYNMGCNFNVAAAIRIMTKYEISILAIQEHYLRWK